MNNDGLELIKRTLATLEPTEKLGSSNFEQYSNRPNTLTRSLMGVIECPEEVAKLKEALNFLDSNVPRGTGSFYLLDGKPDPNYWLAAVWAIKSLGWDCGETIAREWSKLSAIKYSDKGFAKAWKDYKHSHPNPVRIGSLYKRAMELGWKQSPNISPVATSQYKLLNGDDLRNLPPMQWRLKGVLPQVGLAALYGPSASGKSFLALDMSIAIAEGRKWFGIRTMPSHVVYVALEGESGFKKRVSAWEIENNRKLPLSMNMVLQPFQITSPSDVESLASTVPLDCVVIVDTLNRAAPTSDENSSKEMGEILQACKRLQLLIDGLVVLIHHTGKDTTQGARGHSSFFAALDGAIEVKRKNDKRSWSIAKAKDGQDGNDYSFALKLHELGEDTDGDKVTSCTINRVTNNIFVKEPPNGPKQKEALREFKLNVADIGVLNAPAADCPKDSFCVAFDLAVQFIAKTLTTTAKNKRTHEARRLLTSLVNSGHIETALDTNDEAWCWIA
jgi:hypothetical protein